MSLFHFGKKDESPAEENENDFVEIEVEAPADKAPQPEKPVPPTAAAPEADNQALEDALLYYKWDNSEGNLKAMLEKLNTAKLLVPAQNLGHDPAMADKNAVRLMPRFVKGNDEKVYLPVFTSRKHIPDQDKSALIQMPFRQCCDLAARNPKDPRGIVINPSSDNVILSAAVPLAVLGRQPGQPAGDAKATVFALDPSKLPDKVLELVRENAAKYPEIQSIWLRGLKQNGHGIAMFLFHIQGEGQYKPLFEELAKQLRTVYPHPVAFSRATQEMAEKMKDVLPIYRA